MVTHKVCSKCNTIKPVSDYCKDASRKDGLQSQCKSCKAVWARQYYRTIEGKLAHNRSRQQLTEQRQIEIGACIANMLGLKKNAEGRYCTTWGTKTDLGLYLTIKRIMQNIT